MADRLSESQIQLLWRASQNELKFYPDTDKFEQAARLIGFLNRVGIGETIAK